MKLCSSVGLLALLAFAEGAEGLFFRVRSEEDSRCEKIFNFLMHIGTTYREGYSFRMRVDDPAEIRRISCKLANVKNFKDLEGVVGSHDPWGQPLRMAYKSAQTTIANGGGYTNANRFILIMKDFNTWHAGLTPNATTPAEATTLVKLTRFFEVNQVKYGSRWISVIELNQDTVIADPTETARKLYESRSAEEVGKVLGVGRRFAYGVYNVMLVGRIQPSKDIPVQGLAEAVLFFGELGFFNLE